MTIILGLLILSFLIFFHELGHYVAARLFGVKVESFSIGMGPILLHKTVGQTDYRLSLFPVGGYCGMKGEKEFSRAVEEGSGFIEGGSDSLYGCHSVKRAAIGFAGPLFNLIFSFIASSVICMMGYTYYTRSAQIVIPDDPAFDSPAKRAGIQNGDVIVKIQGHNVEDFSDIYEQVALRGDQDIEVVVLRTEDESNEQIQKTFTVHTNLNKKTGNGILGVQASGGVLEKEKKPLPFFPALAQGAVDTGRLLTQTIMSLGILFKGIDVTNAVSGPARISSMLGETAKEGFSAGLKIGLITVLQFLAVISISLFITNLLPIPILDGGLILFALVQAVTKRQIPPKVQYKIQVVGFFLILMIFLVGVSGDIRYFIEKAGKK